MSSEIEAAGATVTAGLVAAAIDGRKGKRRLRPPEGPCANCGEPLSGNYCAECGQPAFINRSLANMAQEFLSGVMYFDIRVMRTVPLLVLRPGTLTHAYIHGKRARFLSPLAMFLLAVFAMFFVFSLTGGARIGIMDPEDRLSLAQSGVSSAEEALNGANAKVAELTRQGAPGGAIEAAQMRADVLGKALDIRKAALEAARKREAAPPETHPGVVGTKIDNEDIIGEAGSVYDEIREAAHRGDVHIQTGFPGLDEDIKRNLENPELAVYKFQNAASQFAFLLAPISLPFIWLMFFWKRGVTLFDHTVYILYSLSFVSILFIAASLLSRWPPIMPFAGPLLLLAGPVHAYFHLKGGYGLGWFSALWRMPLLIVSAAICLVIFLVAILVLGAVG